LIIWQGLGAFAFVIPFFVWLATLFVAEAILGEAPVSASREALGDSRY